MLLQLLFVTAAPVDALELIAHRANGCGLVENSLQAIRASWAAGVDAVELDVRVSQDAVAYLFHDDEIDNRPVLAMEFEELRSLVGEQRTPALRDALRIDAGRGYYILDLKQIDFDSIQPLVSAVLESGFNSNRLVFQSERPSILTDLHRRLPGARYFLLERLNRRLPFFQRPRASQLLRVVPGNVVDGISLKGRRSINETLVRALRQSGLTVLVWTINDEQRAAHYQKLGVEGLITDVPVALSALTDRKTDRETACRGLVGKKKL